MLKTGRGSILLPLPVSFAFMSVSHYPQKNARHLKLRSVCLAPLQTADYILSITEVNGLFQLGKIVAFAFDPRQNLSISLFVYFLGAAQYP